MWEGGIMSKLILLIIALAVAGCAYPRPELTKQVVQESIEVPATDYSSGSIWQAASGGLTEDFKARRRGDMVTVVISEQASASKEATTSTKKDSSVSAGI